jgi:hypothetical protein
MFDCGGVVIGGATTGCAAQLALQQRLLSEALIQIPGQPSLLGQIEPLCCAQVGRVTFCVMGGAGAGCCTRIIARATTTAAIIAVTATIIVFLSM